MCATRLDGDKARQWLETGCVTLMLGLVLHAGSPHLALPESYGWLWRGVSASLQFVAKGIAFY